MKIEEILDKIENEVIITDTEGRIFKGFFSNTESEFDTSSGEEEIEIMIPNKGICIGIPISEIKSIKIIK
jgi:hypothetical protein